MLYIASRRMKVIRNAKIDREMLQAMRASCDKGAIHSDQETLTLVLNQSRVMPLSSAHGKHDDA